MKERKKKVKVVYAFEIRYEHEKHLKSIEAELLKQPILEMNGAGIVGENAYSYSCKRIGNGKFIV